MPDGGGPPNKWVKFPVVDLNSLAVLDKLNQLASEGYNSVAVSVHCVDGPFVFVGGYAKGKK